MLAVVAGALLAVLVVVKVLDIGFITAFDRPFDPVSDSSYVGIGVETLRDAIGRSTANLAVAAIVVLVVGLLALPVLALLRLTRVAAGHRDWALRAAAVLGVALGGPARPRRAGRLHERGRPRRPRGAGGPERACRLSEILAREIPRDRFRATPGDQLLTGLRGKDVLLLFVESYGRVAVQGSSFSPGVDAVLDQGTAQLRAGGFSSRSAFLTSSTFGGLSWLAHSTLQSGIRIGTQRRLRPARQERPPHAQPGRSSGPGGGRSSTTRRTSGRGRRARPSTTTTRSTTAATSATAARASACPRCPTSTSSRALHRLELAKRHRPPLFAEVDLISSHAPWTRIPRLIPWDDVGDGSIFDRVPAEESTRAALFGDSKRARAAYGHSIEYTMSTIVSFVQHYGDDKLVVVLLGDHQPATIVTGQGASHDVPISVIAHDPKVMDQIAGWGWQDGLRPSPQAPVWPMDAFRDRFLTAFGSSPASG